MYRQVRNEKYRSVRSSIPCCLRARSPQSEEKVLLQTYCMAMLASLSQHSRNGKNELTKYTSTLTKSGRHSHNEKQYQFWTAIDIPVATLLRHKCSPPSDYRMGTTGCRIFTSQPNQQGYGNTDSCKSAYQILSPGNRKVTPHLCPNRAMENIVLVQKCTETTRLCGCKTRARVFT